MSASNTGSFAGNGGWPPLANQAVTSDPDLVRRNLFSDPFDQEKYELNRSQAGGKEVQTT